MIRALHVPRAAASSTCASSAHAAACRGPLHLASRSLASGPSKRRGPSQRHIYYIDALRSERILGGYNSATEHASVSCGSASSGRNLDETHLGTAALAVAPARAVGETGGVSRRGRHASPTSRERLRERRRPERSVQEAAHCTRRRPRVIESYRARWRAKGGWLRIEAEKGAERAASACAQPPQSQACRHRSTRSSESGMRKCTLRPSTAGAS